MGIFDNLFCGGNISKAAQLEASNENLASSNASLTKQLDAANTENASQALEISSLNDAITQTADQNKQQISTLAGQLSDCQAKLATDEAQIGGSIFNKPKPTMLDEVPASKVLLGEFRITTAQGSGWYDFPNHPAVYQPCPWFEDWLTKADCNRPRPDLTSIEICTKISNVSQTTLHYTLDQTQWGYPDNWTPAIIVKALGTDDCESEAQTIASAIMYYEQKFVSFKDMTVTTGYGHLIIGGQPYGHGFVVIQHNTSTALTDSYIIEATLEQSSYAMPFSNAKSDYQIDWGLSGYIRNAHPDGTYWMNQAYSWWGATGKAMPGCDCKNCQHARGIKRTGEGIISMVKRKFTGKKAPHEIKNDYLRERWKNLKRGD